MKLTNVTRLLLYASVIACLAPSCVKEGPMGLTGAVGADGKDGVDANETCKVCHTPAKVDLISVQYEFSKHGHGEAAFDESGNVACTPCHAQEAYKYVVKNNVPSTFTLNAATGKWVNNYATVATDAYGEIGCSTCHSSIHGTYGSSDLPALTNVAPVSMTMWGGTKTIDLKADGGKSNLCVKCHQPRPFTNAIDGSVQDYVAIAANPAGVMYDGIAESPNTTDKIRPGYRTHTHYGTAGAVYAGMGGVEFAGTLAYTNSAHTTAASCVDCHMSVMNERAGGHTFFMRNGLEGSGLTSSTKWNFNGCNTTGCHPAEITSTSTTLWVNPRNDIKILLNSLAAKLTIGGVDILNRNADPKTNLWAGITTNNYDGYLNVYDPITNPTGQTYNTTSFKYVGTVPATWSQAQKDYNATLPSITLTNAQFGALINFQLCLRDYSLGIHNYKYTQALLTNSIAKL